jgi:hypothetical protein
LNYVFFTFADLAAMSSSAGLYTGNSNVPSGFFSSSPSASPIIPLSVAQIASLTLALIGLILGFSAILTPRQMPPPTYHFFPLNSHFLVGKLFMPVRLSNGFRVAFG